MTTALIDGDVVAFRCAASCMPSQRKAEAIGLNKGDLELEPVEIAIQRCDELMNRILSTVNATDYKLFLSGGNNWRKHLFPEYKANRKDKPIPPHLFACQDFLREQWAAIDCPGHEADDGIGIAAGPNTIICSNDKDLKTIPGSHYNFVTEEFEEVDEERANYYYWYLMLVGDSSDNIKGVEGIGPKKAQRFFSNTNPQEWEEMIRDLYGDDDRFELNRRLIRIIRSTEELKAIEATISESQREELTESSGQGDFDPFSTVNS